MSVAGTLNPVCALYSSLCKYLSLFSIRASGYYVCLQGGGVILT